MLMERLIHINHLSYVFICFNVVDLAKEAIGLMTDLQNEKFKAMYIFGKSLFYNTLRVLLKTL